MEEKHKVISSYSDLDDSLHLARQIHFRKFLNKRLLSIVLSKCRNLEKISLSHYAFKKCDKKLLENLKKEGIKIVVRKGYGRRSLIEMIL